jgi:hypothetical protein
VPLASVTAENQALQGLDASAAGTNLMAYTSLHTATPGTTGASENAATGGYARQSSAQNAASGGAKTNSGALAWTTTGATPVTHVGEWSAVTAGTYGIGAALTSSITAASITAASGAISYSAA